MKKPSNAANTTQNSEPNGTERKATKKATRFYPGDEVVIKKTGAHAQVATVVACGEPGHDEIRYYLRDDPRCGIYYFEDLKRPPKRKRRGWGHSCKNG